MKPIKILLQTTIPTASDDWPITRFTLLAQFLREQRQGWRTLMGTCVI